MSQPAKVKSRARPKKVAVVQDVQLSEETQARLRSHIKARGASVVAVELEIGLETALRAASGAHVRRSTARHIEATLRSAAEAQAVEAERLKTWGEMLGDG